MAMNLNEDATLTLKANTRDFANELAQLDTKAKELKKTLKEIETSGTGKGSDEWKQYKAELANVNAELAKTRRETDLTKLTYGQLSNLVGQLTRDLKGLVPGTDAFNAAVKRLDAAKTQLADVDKQVKGINTESDQLGAPTRWKKITDGVGMVSKVVQAFVALAFVGYILDIGKAIFEITGKFEKYEKVLTTALGSEKLAKESLAAIQQIAKNTVFSVDELTDGYVKLVNRGMRPSQKEMIAMTDLAASQGKTFDDLVEAALDAQTGEFERLKEFGIRGSKSGDQVTLSFKGMNQTVKNTPDAIQGAITKFGEMNGVAGQNAQMMETLNGKASNLGDSFDALKVELGTGLRPVFVAILDLISMSIPAIGFLSKAIGTVFVFIKGQVVGVMDTVKNTGLAIFEFGKAAFETTQLNFEGAKKAWDNSKTYAKAALTSSAEAGKQSMQHIEAIWSNPAASVKAEFAGKDQGNKYQGGLTDAQKKALKEREAEAEKARKKEVADHKKHLEDVQKANEKALEDLSKLEAESHIAGIKDEMQREFAKLQAKRDLAAEEIMRGIQDEKLKNQQIANLDKTLEEDVARVAAEFAEKKRKKAEDEEKKRLDTQKNIIEQERQAENALLDWKELMAKGNAKKLAEIHKERVDKNYQATVDKLDAEEAAETAKANREITDKAQLDQALTAIEAKYHNEGQLAEKKHADEVAAINKELQDKKKAMWGEASSAFGALLKGDMSSFLDHADKLVQGEKSALQKKLKANEETYAAIGAMATQAVNFLADLAKKKADQEIEQAKRERDEKVRLLNDAIAVEQAAMDANALEKAKVTQESDDKIQAIKSASEKTVSDLESQYRTLSSSEEKKKLDDQLAGYKENADGKTEAAKQTAQDAIEAAQDESKQTIEAADKAAKAAIASATNAKNERIDAAEATRDAEIAAINKRKDVDQATRKQLLDEAKAKFDTEKKLAEDEAKIKIDEATATAKQQRELATATAKLKTELAKDQSEAELKAIEATKNGDDKAAKEILARAKQDQQEKIRLAKEQADKAIQEAENEKREKLKKVAAQNATLVQNKKDLERQIQAEDAKAKAIEAATKLKAWQAQKKADMASALITGALATIKALASGFWPVNLVFAALSAVMTGVQVAMISRQQPPAFEHGGFIPTGGRHASTYGKGGIGLIDRQTGREVGEMEGEEAIISREQTKANMPLIQQMFANARTPGKRNVPVSSDRNALGVPAGFRQGGLFDQAVWSRDMYRYGGLPGKRPTPPNRPNAARRYDEGDIVDSGSGDGGRSDGLGTANADYEESKKQFQEQIKKLEEIKVAVEKGADSGRTAIQNMDNDLRWAISYLQNATTQGLTNVQSTTKSSIDSLNQNLVLTLRQLQSKQANDADKIIMALLRGMDWMDHNRHSDTQDATRQTVEAINSAKLTNQQSVANLATRIERSQAQAADQTERAINKASLTNQVALSNLALKTVTSLTNLSTDTKRALASLQTATVRALAEQAAREEKALADLSRDLLNELDWLNRNTTSSLTSLGNKTEGALTNSANRTTRSVDSLSVEVRNLKGSINAVEGAVYQVRGAVNGVEGAVWGSNQSGRLDALIGAISVFGRK